jgi:hypothetical protein
MVLFVLFFKKAFSKRKIKWVDPLGATHSFERLLS